MPVRYSDRCPSGSRAKTGSRAAGAAAQPSSTRPTVRTRGPRPGNTAARSGKQPKSTADTGSGSAAQTDTAAWQATEP